MSTSNQFFENFGRPAESCWAAPGRVNLIGEYTDLNDGFVLPMAIPQVTRVAAALRGDRHLRVRSLQGGESSGFEADLDSDEGQEGWGAYPLAVARALEASGVRLVGADMLIDSEVPMGAGLSSSAALECSVALALCALSRTELLPMETARIAQRAENEYVGVPCGIMDQAASMCCTAGHVLFLDTRSLATSQVPLDLKTAGLALLVVDSRVKHGLGDSAYAERRKSCQDAARLLGVPALRDVPGSQASAALGRLAELGDDVIVRRARHVLSEQARVLEVVHHLEAGEPEAIGPVLLAGHRSLRDDFEVSCPELDTIVAAATEAGALGARLTGAGFGGSAIVLVREGAVDAVEAAVMAAFAGCGFAPPACFRVEASPGARRETCET
jgi:galactokinase